MLSQPTIPYSLMDGDTFCFRTSAALMPDLAKMRAIFSSNDNTDYQSPL
jgi:hypothetical protein